MDRSRRPTATHVGDPALLTGTLSRRHFLALSAAAASAAGLAARATAQSPSAGSLAGSTVEYWTQPYGDQEVFRTFYDSLVQAFSAETGITVTVEQVPWEQALQKWDLVMTSGDVPDAADVFYLQARVVQGQGQWGPKDIRAEVEAGRFGDWSRFVEVAQVEAAYKDGIYQVPWRIDPRAFIYNADFWPSAPQDLDEFEAVGKEVLGKGVEAASAFTGLTQQVATQLGAVWDVQILTPDLTASALDDPRWAEAFAWAKRLVDEGVFANPVVTPFEAAHFLNERTVASVFGWNAGLKAMAAGTAPQLVDKIASSLMPMGPSGRHQSTASTAGFSVFQNTAVPDAAMAWVEFLARPENAFELSRVSQQTSPDTTVQDLDDDPYMQPFYEQSRIALGIDQPTPAWAALTAPDGPIDVLVKSVFSGEDITAALEAAHTGTNEIVAQYP